MKKTDIIKKTKEIIVDVMELEMSIAEVSGQDLINELGINSIDSVEILVTVESEFDIEISDEDLNSELIQSLDNLVNYIAERLQIHE